MSAILTGRTIPWVILLAAGLLAGAAAAAEPSADALSAEGRKLYRAGEPAAAAAKLRQAIALNPELARAHWNLARSLAALHAAGKACAHEAQRSTIIRHLFKACRLHPRFKRRLRREKAFGPVRDTFAWQRLRGLTTRKPRHVKRILRRVSWYGPPGAGGQPASGLRFEAKGKCTLWLRPENDPAGELKLISGRWRSSRSRVLVELDEPYQEQQQFQGELKPTGTLWLPGLPGPFSDDAHECAGG